MKVLTKTTTSATTGLREETRHPGPKRVLEERMSAILARLRAKYANEDTGFHDSVPESAFEGERRPFGWMAAKHHKRGATRSKKTRNISSKKAPAKILQENNESSLGATSTSSKATGAVSKPTSGPGKLFCSTDRSRTPRNSKEKTPTFETPKNLPTPYDPKTSAVKPGQFQKPTAFVKPKNSYQSSRAGPSSVAPPTSRGQDRDPYEDSSDSSEDFNPYKPPASTPRLKRQTLGKRRARRDESK